MRLCTDYTQAVGSPRSQRSISTITAPTFPNASVPVSSSRARFNAFQPVLPLTSNRGYKTDVDQHQDKDIEFLKAERREQELAHIEAIFKKKLGNHAAMHLISPYKEANLPALIRTRENLEFEGNAKRAAKDAMQKEKWAAVSTIGLTVVTGLLGGVAIVIWMHVLITFLEAVC